MITSLSDGSRRGVPIEAGSSAIRSDQVGYSHGLLTVWACSTGSQALHKHATVVTALLTEASSLAFWTLVDDRRLWQTCGQTESDLVRRTLAQAEAALSTRVVAIGLAALSGENATARAAHPLVRRWSSIVTQRGFPPVVAGGGASSCPSKPAGGRHGPGDPGSRRPGWDHRRSAPDARPPPAVG